MYDIEGSIKFISDVLFNKPTESSLESTESGQRGKKKTVDQKIAQTSEMLHRDGDGKTIVVPGDCFKLSYLAGSGFAGLKVGKKSIYPFLNALTFPEELSFGVSEPDYIHKWPGKVPPKTGAMVILRRPAFKAGHKLKFKIMVADDQLEPEQIKISIQQAGLFVGIGSWRPKFGRFQLVDWKVKK